MGSHVRLCIIGSEHGPRQESSNVMSKAQSSFGIANRDYNAAMNILACYMAVASGHKRPDAFDRSFK